jgi:hypothetical protein
MVDSITIALTDDTLCDAVTPLRCVQHALEDIAADPGEYTHAIVLLMGKDGTIMYQAGPGLREIRLGMLVRAQTLVQE